MNAVATGSLFAKHGASNTAQKPHKKRLFRLRKKVFSLKLPQKLQRPYRNCFELQASQY